MHTDLGTAVQELRESLGLFEVRGEHMLLQSRADSIDCYARELARLPFDFEILASIEL